MAEVRRQPDAGEAADLARARGILLAKSARRLRYIDANDREEAVNVGLAAAWRWHAGTSLDLCHYLVWRGWIEALRTLNRDRRFSPREVQAPAGPAEGRPWSLLAGIPAGPDAAPEPATGTARADFEVLIAPIGTPRGRELLRGRFLDGRTIARLAAEAGVCKQTICLRLQVALAELRRFWERTPDGAIQPRPARNPRLRA